MCSAALFYIKGVGISSVVNILHELTPAEEKKRERPLTVLPFIPHDSGWTSSQHVVTLLLWCIYLVSRIHLCKHCQEQSRGWRVNHSGDGSERFSQHHLPVKSQPCMATGEWRRKKWRSEPKDDSSICPWMAERLMEMSHDENNQGFPFWAKHEQDFTAVGLMEDIF